MNAITQLSGTTPGPPILQTPPTTASEGESLFKNLLVDSIQQFGTAQVEANHVVETLFTGSNAHSAEVLTEVQKADLTFRLTLQIQNKLMNVYREIQEIQI